MSVGQQKKTGYMSSAEVEDLERQFRTKEMHQKIKQMTNKSKTNTNMGCIKDRNGNILFDRKITEGQVEYIKNFTMIIDNPCHSLQQQLGRTS